MLNKRTFNDIIFRTLLLICIASFISGIYFYGVLSTKDKFPEGTYINNIDVGKMNLEEADNALKELFAWEGIKILNY